MVTDEVEPDVGLEGIEQPPAPVPVTDVGEPGPADHGVWGCLSDGPYRGLGHQDVVLARATPELLQVGLVPDLPGRHSAVVTGRGVSNEEEPVLPEVSGDVRPPGRLFQDPEHVDLALDGLVDDGVV